MKSLITQLLLVTAMACGSAGAQQVTKFVVPFAAGGATDGYVRLMAAELTKAGLPVIVENRAGASGIIAADYVARSRPDGLTVLAATNGQLVTNLALFDKLPYDPVKDFVPVSQIGAQPVLVVARTNLPYSNLMEMVAYAKANPGKINRGSPGAGSLSTIAPLMFERMASISTTNVPYNGDPPAIHALLSGDIEIYGTTITSSLPHIRSGRLRVLGVFGNQRLPQLPDVPTFIESGYNVDAYGWFTLVAPAGTPREAIDRLNKVVNQVLAQEDFIAKAREMGLEPRGGSPDDLGRLIRTEQERWLPMLKSQDLPKNN